MFSFSLKNLCFPKETRFFNVAVVTEGVINQLRLKYPRVFERIDIKSSLKDKYTYTEICNKMLKARPEKAFL